MSLKDNPKQNSSPFPTAIVILCLILIVSFQNCAQPKAGGELKFRPPEGSNKNTSPFADTHDIKVNLGSPPVLDPAVCGTGLKTCAVTFQGTKSGSAYIFDQDARPLANQLVTLCVKGSVEINFARRNCILATTNNFGVVTPHENNNYLCVGTGAASASLWIGNQTENPVTNNAWGNLGSVSTAQCL